MKLPGYIITALLLTSLSARPQRQDIRFTHLGTDKGLSHSNVICILQDSRGLMWFGTADGLNKYDGYNFTIYRNQAANPNSLTSSNINSIGEDQNHIIWIGSNGGGLNSFNTETGKFRSYRHNPADSKSIISDFINALFVDKLGFVWLATGDGLDKFDTKTGVFTHYTHKPSNPGSLCDDNVYTVFEDAAGNIWAGTMNSGLDFLDVKTGVFRHYRHINGNSSSLSNNFVTVVYQDSHGQIWVGTNGGGLNLFNPANGSFRSFTTNRANTNSILADVVYALCEDKGKLLVGTENGGLSIYNPADGSFTNYQHDDVDGYSLGNNSIEAIYKDTKGNIWLGTFSSGVDLINADNASFLHYRHSLSPNSLSSNKVLCMLDDPEGNVWVGTDGGGLNKLNPKTNTFTHYLHRNGDKNSICGNYVLDVEDDKDGNLWIGTWGDGVTVMNVKKNTFRHYKNNPADPGSLSSDNAWYIYEDRQKNIWVGTQGGGLNLYNPAKDNFTHFRPVPGDSTSLGSDIVYGVYQDHKMRYWISTQGGGLELFNPKTGKFKHYTHHDGVNSIADDKVGTIYDEENGTLWIPTPKGLDAFNTETGIFTLYTVADGLPGDQVFGIAEDNHDNFWMGTSNGLAKFNKLTKKFYNYTESDGLQGKEFKENACLNAHNGLMYFGGNNGFNVFNPDSVRSVPFDPPLVFTGFNIFNQPVAIGDSANNSPLAKDISVTDAVTLSYKQSVISIQFASLNYTSAAKKRYRYMLEGFDEKWIDAGTAREATYTNLNAGHYTFKVQGLDNEGNWSSKVLTLGITVTPPWWQTWWFRVLAVLFAAGCVVAVFRIRISNIKRHNAELEKQVEQRTRQLNQAIEQERLARHNEELARLDAEKANRAKSVFLATMSHEIRTPLNGVIGMSSLLSETVLTPEQEDYAGTIKSCGESLMSVINDVLDFSKIESGNMELEQNDFDLRTCIEEVLDVFAGNRSKPDIDLVYQVDYNVPGYIIGDVHRLRQVLMNLVGNAVKFTHKGEIFVGVHLAPPTGQGAGINLQFEVRDTGIGIPPDKVDRLFKAFSQVDSSTTRKYGGSGLGLVICQKLVQLMGGDIRVESTPGKGTTFYFNIITFAASQASRKYVQFNNSEMDGRKVLIVDDNPTNRKILQTQLEQWKMQPVQAASGLEGVAALQAQGPFDLLITDMHMPGMDGIEFGRTVRQKYPGMPIVLLSSIGDEHSRRHPDIFNVVLNKPVKQYALYKCLAEQLKLKEKQKDEAALSVAETKKTGENFALLYPLQILIAEDNIINVKLVTHVLGKLGYNPVVANDGQEVLEKFVLNHFDVILMDVQMPEIDGLEATRIIRRQDTQQPVIIAMTANATREDREECLQAGMDDYLSKPMQLDKLVAVLEKWARIKNSKTT